MSLLLIGSAGVLLAAFLGGATGFGYALVSVPFLLLAGLPLADVVVVNLALGLLTRVAVLWRLRAALDRGRVGLLLGGGLPGIALGYALARGVDGTLLEIGAGCAILLGASLAAVRELRSGAPRTASRAAVTAAGAAGGVLGVTTSLNGLVPALVLRGDGAGPRGYVANLAAYFVIGNAIMLAVLLAAGEGAAQTPLWTAMVWLAAGLAGNALGVRVLDRIPERLFHRVTLAVVLVSGAAALAQSLARL
ncbi:hypothetical protein CLV63_101107 [Murinocardiopsis flavida]|uniref:Probable membrane transporter protein n=1 Tax=Murinocardiopsis flavida TaxID=645275 RepID=A0A2P8DTV5_9ACTN|nr:TSUP family transporter [Murinocardiopsis flavida]PSL00633.1 hypothetical protein CLV63_101107 [Murinocardiopsis flavida]